MAAIIRPFAPQDRLAVLTIGAETAFFGEPIEHYVEDRRIFMEGFYSYYTDYEPEHAWVAADGAQVVGFLTGCIDSKRHERILTRRILPRVLWKIVSGQYRMGPKTWQYLRAGARAARRGEMVGVDIGRYPAHLHINLLPGWRGHGLGRGLIGAYLDQLRSLGVPGVHLSTTSQNVTACQLYEKLGFQLLGKRSTRMYAHLLGHEIEMRAYGMEIS